MNWIFLLIGMVLGSSFTWLLLRKREKPYTVPVGVVPAAEYVYEVRLNGKTIFPGPGQDDSKIAEAKSTYYDNRLPRGSTLEFFTRGNHTASRRIR